MGQGFVSEITFPHRAQGCCCEKGCGYSLFYPFCVSAQLMFPSVFGINSRNESAEVPEPSPPFCSDRGKVMLGQITSTSPWEHKVLVVAAEEEEWHIYKQHKASLHVPEVTLKTALSACLTFFIDRYQYNQHSLNAVSRLSQLFESAPNLEY